MSRGITTFCFALVAVRRGDRLLLVHEGKHGRRVVAAGVRGRSRRVVRGGGGAGDARGGQSAGAARRRCAEIFTATPLDDAPPKSRPDEHSVEARWCTVEEIERLPLRGDEPLQLPRYLAKGGAIYPLSVLTPEAAPR